MLRSRMGSGMLGGQQAQRRQWPRLLSSAAAGVSTFPRGWGSVDEGRLLSANSPLSSPFSLQLSCVRPCLLQSSVVSRAVVLSTSAADATLLLTPSFAASLSSSLVASLSSSRQLVLYRSRHMVVYQPPSLSSFSAGVSSFSQQVVLYRPRHVVVYQGSGPSLWSILLARADVLKDIRMIWTWEDEKAILDYSGPGYTAMNQGLRGMAVPSLPALRQRLHDRICAVDKALSKLPDCPGVSYRGTAFDDSFIDSSLQEGAIFSDPTFLSTSAARKEALSGFCSNCMFTIHGRTGKDIAAFSTFKHEKEVLFRPGSVFRILKTQWKDLFHVDRGDFRVLFVTMEQIE